MRIVIIGGGICGLSTYLALRKYLPKNQNHSVVIHEAHDLTPYVKAVTADRDGHPPGPISKAVWNDSKIVAPGQVDSETAAAFTPEVIGSAIGIMYNGLKVLSRIVSAESSDVADPEAANIKSDANEGFSELMADVLRAGHPITTWEMSAARGWKLIEISMTPSSMRSKSTKESDQLQRGVTGIMISRQGFWQTLLAETVRVATSDYGAGGVGQVLKQGRVAQVHWAEQELDLSTAASTRTKAVSVTFEDGRCEAADLVIGADGVRSVVRKEMFKRWQSPDHEMSEISGPSRAEKPDYVSPRYEGLVGVGGFIPATVLQPLQRPGKMGIVFGANGFFGYGYSSSQIQDLPDRPTLDNAPSLVEPGATAVWWSTFASPVENPYPISNQGQNSKRSRPWDFDRAAALAALLERHRGWTTPAVQAILDYLESRPEAVEGFYPTWTAPSLPTWHKGPVLLVGDAAHALQPSSGQGTSLALEDAEALAICLSHHYRPLSSPVTDDEVWQTQTEKALKSFEKVRMPRVREQYDRSQKMGGMKDNMSIVTEMMMYGAVKLMGILGRLFGGDRALDRLLAYDLPSEVLRVLEAEEAAVRNS
jgi:2-polyprenyl-6-methoxyphenol hydroxylase-like FAD-dependent oxidoreductase